MTLHSTIRIISLPLGWENWIFKMRVSKIASMKKSIQKRWSNQLPRSRLCSHSVGSAGKKRGERRERMSRTIKTKKSFGKKKEAVLLYVAQSFGEIYALRGRKCQYTALLPVMLQNIKSLLKGKAM